MGKDYPCRCGGHFLPSDTRSVVMLTARHVVVRGNLHVLTGPHAVVIGNIDVLSAYHGMKTRNVKRLTGNF